MVVKTGYAFDCCGNDIIVCQDDTVDLADHCEPDKPDCAEIKAVAQEEDEDCPGDCVLDLYIRYVEKLTDPQATLGRSACREVDDCDYSRTQEGYAFDLREAQDPEEAAYENWEQNYKNWLEVQAALAADKEMGDEAQLLHLMEHFHNGIGSDGCGRCETGHGVRLARIWLKPPARRGQAAEVVVIDAYPPYKRPLHHTPWPTFDNKINLARFIWHPTEAAHQAELPYDGESKELVSSTRAINILRNPQQYMLRPRGSWLFPYVVTLPCVGERIVGFASPNSYSVDREAVAQNSTNNAASLLEMVEPAPVAAKPVVEEADDDLDDLGDIKYIGAKAAEALHEAGCRTFSDVGTLTIDELREIFDKSSYRTPTETRLGEILESARDLMAKG